MLRVADKYHNITTTVHRGRKAGQSRWFNTTFKILLLLT